MTIEHTDRVASHFRTHWADYDRQIRTSIPFYDSALDVLVDVIRRSGRSPERILDLGIGTGNLASRLIDAFPAASLTGIDLNAEFLRIAENRLRSNLHRVQLIEADVGRYEFESGYDLIVSSFMLHHVPDDVKRRAYENALSCLVEEGCFVNAEFVDSPSPHWSRVFDDIRMDFMRSEGASEESVTIQYVEHRKLEIPVPLEIQLCWLAEFGFVDVECFWKYLNLAVFGGRKSPGSE